MEEDAGTVAKIRPKTGKKLRIKPMVTRLPVDFRSRFAEEAEGETSLASVAAKVVREPEREGAMRVLVTGVGCDGAGAAVDFARALRVNGRTVLVETCAEPEAEGRGPLGISDFLAGRASFDDIIHRDRMTGLHLVPTGRGGEILTEGFDVAIEALARTYDYLVVLAAPVDAEPDAQVLATDADLALAICGAHADEGMVESATQALRDAGAREVVAIVADGHPGEPGGDVREAA
jgi:Mrp family chromosome partitioning ATPase